MRGGQYPNNKQKISYLRHKARNCIILCTNLPYSPDRGGATPSQSGRKFPEYSCGSVFVEKGKKKCELEVVGKEYVEMEL